MSQLPGGMRIASPTLGNPRRSPKRPPGTVSPNEVSADKSNRRKVSQDPVKRAGAGHIDMNDVLVKIRKIVREGFNLPGSWCCSQCFREGHGWFGKRSNGFG